jgi:hypothetical protein
VAKKNQEDADDYLKNVNDLLQRESFEKLDAIVLHDRAEKARFGGGGWKIRTFYQALKYFSSEGEPKKTDEQWEAHIGKLKKWVQARPTFVAARVGLAETYLSYGYHARGGGYSDTVTDKGWELFGQRTKLSHETLVDAEKLKEKCPEWYLAMQDVALAEGWDKQEARALFDEAIKFEPDYQYYCSVYANYLLPKWYGDRGEAEKFAEDISDRIGGSKGDMIYYQIATLSCYCGESSLHLIEMSWPRILRGSAALESKYGPSILRLNQLAYFAGQFADGAVENKAFHRMGDGWTKSLWRDHDFFLKAKQEAEEREKYNDYVFAEMAKGADAPGGREYDQKVVELFGKQLAGEVSKCVSDIGNQNGGSDVYLSIWQSGKPFRYGQCLAPLLRIA